MNIARPINGFNVVERPAVLDTLADNTSICPWLQSAYSNVKQHLRMAGHKVGYATKNNNISRRIFIEADPMTNKNRMAIAYEVLGDRLTLIAMTVVIQKS